MAMFKFSYKFDKEQKRNGGLMKNMNYLNNPLNNYPYGYINQYVPQPQPQQFLSQPMVTQNQQPPQALNGKIVDSADVVKATEVPIGGYGIFPKADLSEIYIKSWNNNGTTSVITFRPVSPEPQLAEIEDTVMNVLVQKIDVLNGKLDAILTPRNTTEQKTTQQKKVEVKNEF